MQFTIKTKGKPADVQRDVRASVKQLRASKNESAAVATALSDEVARQLAGYDKDVVVTVAATIELTIKDETPKAAPIADKPEALK